MDSRRIWTALQQNIVIVINDLSGPYFTVPSGASGTDTYNKITFLDFDDAVSENTNTNFADEQFMVCNDCDFINCQRIMQKSNVAQIIPIMTNCVFDGCGKTVPLFDDIQSIEAKFFNCTFYNIDCGTNNVITFTQGLDVVKNNIFELITASRIWSFTVTDANAIFLSIDFNTYRESTFTLSTGFAVTGTGEKALLTNLRADTSAETDGLSVNPDMVDPTKGLFSVTQSGNSDRTGSADGFRGARGVGIGMSTNINGATQWDNSLIVPSGESTLVSGNWEHTGTTATVVTVEFPELDTLAVNKVTMVIFSFENDAPEGVLDFTLADGKRTFELKSADTSPIPSAYAETIRGDNTLAIENRFFRSKVTQRNDG